jgi:hypothetical protein
MLDLQVTLLSGEVRALRFVYGRELDQLGAAYSRLAERVGAESLVGEILLDVEVRELLQAAV